MKQNRHNYTGNQKVQIGDEVLKVESHSPPHLGIVHIDSMDRLEYTTYSTPRFEIGGEIIRRTINKLALSEIQIFSNIPNVNEQNTNIRFETATGIHSVDLFVQYYTVPDLMAHIITRLNTLSGVSNVVFSLINLYGNFYKITGTLGFKFLSSSHVDRAEPLSGIYITDNFVIDLFVSADGLYTRYIDFLSSDLKESQILENLFTKDYAYSIINHLYRYDIIEGTKPYSDKLQIKNLSYSSVRSKERNILSLTLYNQFGDLLYSPTIQYNNQKVNIDVFKYSLKLSVSV